MKNYYDILEVSRKASKDTINKVFKMHMKANHPDLFQGAEKQKAEEKSKELTEAYNTLSDDTLRAKYDAELEAEESTSQYGNVQAIMEENEYLKQVLAKKNEYINRLMINLQAFDVASVEDPMEEFEKNFNRYDNDNYTKERPADDPYNARPEPPPQEPTNSAFEYYKEMIISVAKKVGIVCSILLVGIIVLVLLFFKLKDILFE